MLSVYTRHHPDCAKKDDSAYRRCRCPKWLDGTLPGRSGRFRVSAKTKSWEQAELVARKYENSALSGEDLKPAKMPTVKETGEIFRGPVERQTEIFLDQLKLCVETAGSSLENILKLNVYVTSFSRYVSCC